MNEHLVSEDSIPFNVCYTTAMMNEDSRPINCVL